MTESNRGRFNVRTYLDALARNLGQKPGLERIQYLLDALGNPHQSYPIIHVAGTNGKGSTSAMITKILQAAGLRVGLFTSPHLEVYNERIRIGDTLITDGELQTLLDTLWPAVEAAGRTSGVGQPTEFEVGTAIAFAHFARQRVDAAVVEVGLGGRLDTTNVVNPMVSVITPIGKDHMDVLGYTLPLIAAEKAGIIKPGKPVVSAPQRAEVWPVLRATAEAKGSRLVEMGWDARFRARRISPSGGEFDFAGDRWRLDGLRIGLLGEHQVTNAATAVAACEIAAGAGLPVEAEHVRVGLAATRWPGRFEVFPGTPTVVLDATHNAHGAWTLAQTIEQVFPGRRPVFVVGMLAEKQVDRALAHVLPLGGAAVCTRPSAWRTPPLPPAEMARRAKRFVETVEVIETPAEALARARELAGPDGLVCVWGSIYLMGEVRAGLNRV